MRGETGVTPCSALLSFAQHRLAWRSVLTSLSVLLGAISVALCGTRVARISSRHGGFFGMLYRRARSFCHGAVPALRDLQTICTPLRTQCFAFKVCCAESVPCLCQAL